MNGFVSFLSHRNRNEKHFTEQNEQIHWFHFLRWFEYGRSLVQNISKCWCILMRFRCSPCFYSKLLPSHARNQKNWSNTETLCEIRYFDRYNRKRRRVALNFNFFRMSYSFSYSFSSWSHLIKGANIKIVANFNRAAVCYHMRIKFKKRGNDND